jgi:hypothetical protein
LFATRAPNAPHEAGHRVDDANGQALAYIYGRDTHVAHQAKGLTQDEARRIAAGIARLPELVAQRLGAGEADG